MLVWVWFAALLAACAAHVGGGLTCTVDGVQSAAFDNMTSLVASLDAFTERLQCGLSDNTTIPTELGELSSLTALVLSGSGLSGSLPFDYILNLQSLNTL